MGRWGWGGGYGYGRYNQPGKKAQAASLSTATLRRIIAQQKAAVAKKYGGTRRKPK